MLGLEQPLERLTTKLYRNIFKEFHRKKKYYYIEFTSKIKLTLKFNQDDNSYYVILDKPSITIVNSYSNYKSKDITKALNELYSLIWRDSFGWILKSQSK